MSIVTNACIFCEDLSSIVFIYSLNRPTRCSWLCTELLLTNDVRFQYCRNKELGSSDQDPFMLFN